MKIYAPVKDFHGFRNNVRFVKGVGETDDNELIQWFINHGYTIEKSVEKCEDSIEKLLEKCDEIESRRVEQAATVQSEDVGTVNQPDFESMTPNELREWMKENGYGFKIKNIRSKDKLLEIIRG